MSSHHCALCSFASDRLHDIAAEATRLAQPIVEGRLAELRDVIAEAPGYEAASRSILELAVTWKPDALAAVLQLSLELAALEGREGVFLDLDAAGLSIGEASQPASFAEGDNPIEQSFRSQIEFLRQKRPLPTQVWQDAMQGDHDRGFVIAGATDVAMLEEFQAAVVDAARTYDYDAFAAEFDRIVETYGWSYKGGREWRIRTIFETNLRTSHMAGRYAQMRDPDVVTLMPWWQYIHGESRTPMQPRPMHVAWDGLLARWDDPWWDVHFPPNDWSCSCGVRPMSERLARQEPRWGQPVPADMTRGVLDRARQRTVQVPQGIGLGWDYAPGKLWERGLVPSRLEASGQLVPEGPMVVSIDPPRPMPEVVAAARPFTSAPLPLNLADEDYARAFLEPFGATLDRAVLWEDAAGTQMPISAELFRDATGSWDVGPRDQAALAPLLAETLLDPDEIWIGLARRVDPLSGREEAVVDRRYIRIDGETGLSIAFEMGRKWWRAVASYAGRAGSSAGLLRGGRLLFRRRQ